MISNSRVSGWVVIALLVMLASCATEPYYEAAPITPVSTSPSDDVEIGVNAQTTFVWLPTENTQFYEFHIYNQITKDIKQYSRTRLLDNAVCRDGLCRLTMNVDLPKAKGHAWRVRAGNNAGLSEWNRTRFNMVDASTATNSSAEAIASLSLSSSAESGANAEVAADAEADASDVVMPNPDQFPSVELITDAQTETETNAPVSEGSEADTLVTLKSQPAATVPALMQPTEGVKVESGSLVDFMWRSLPGAVSYDFFIYDSVSKKMVESLTNIAATTLCRSGNICRLTRVVALPVASHAWRVRANFNNSQSPFSSSRFAVVR